MLNELTRQNCQGNTFFFVSRGLKVSDYASLNNQKTKTDELKNLIKDSEDLARSSTAR